jgi:hypothetical protein
MGMSAFKLFLILAAVGVLFLPTLIRRSSALPAALEQLRSRIAGEDPVQDRSVDALANATGQDAKPGIAERFGGMLARVNNPIRFRNRG